MAELQGPPDLVPTRFKRKSKPKHVKKNKATFHVHRLRLPKAVKKKIAKIHTDRARSAGHSPAPAPEPEQDLQMMQQVLTMMPWGRFGV
jgi:hypothetical protein